MEKTNTSYSTALRVGIAIFFIALAFAMVYMIRQANKTEDVALSYNTQITRDYLAGKSIPGNKAWWITDRSYAYEKNIARELNISDKELAQKLMGENYVITIRPMSNGPAPTH